MHLQRIKYHYLDSAVDFTHVIQIIAVYLHVVHEQSVVRSGTHYPDFEPQFWVPTDEHVLNEELKQARTDHRQ